MFYISLFILLHSLYLITAVKLENINLNIVNKAQLTPLSIPKLETEPPLKILLLVEPTPFNYVSGYANRFKEMLKYLKKAGDEVIIITPDRTANNISPNPQPPTEYLNYPIISPRGFEFPLYKQVTLTFDFKMNIPKIVKEFKPDLIHLASPSAILVPAVMWARILNIPLVMSYHTDFAGYARNYASFPGRIVVAHKLIRFFHHFADLTLCTSPQLKDDLESLKVRRVDVWQKGINAEIFSPKFRNDEMRYKLSQGNVDSPLLLYVGRLGIEKGLERLKKVLEVNPNARLALVGTGPSEDKLKSYFKDYPVYFAGQLIGDELSKAYASCDIFVMPSDTETLGFVVMEAMASGLPVVGVAAGGVVDLIEHNKTGYLASNKDNMMVMNSYDCIIKYESEFSNYVKILIENKELIHQFGGEAYNWAQNWSWETATSKLRNIQYRKALALHQSRDIDGKHIIDIENALMNH